MVWAIVGAAIVIVHLIPFFLVDRVMLLTTLAYAGVIVNAAILVHLDRRASSSSAAAPSPSSPTR